MVNTERYAPDYKVLIGGVDVGKPVNLHDALSQRPVDLVSVSITETINQADTFALTLRSRHRQLERFPNGEELAWIDDDGLKAGTEVIIEMGYVDNLAVRMVGTIRAASFSFAESGLINVRVDGQSLYSRLFDRRRRQPFADKTDSAIAEQIAGEMKLQAVVDPTTVEYQTVSNRDETCAAILQSRADRLYYELTVKEKTLYFQKPRYLIDTSPTQSLIWGESLLSFSPRINTNGLVTRVEVRNTQTSHGGATAPIIAVVNADDVPPRLGKRSGAQLMRAKSVEKVLLSEDQQVTTAEEATTIATAQYRSKAIGFIEGQGATIGNPQIRARSVIEFLRLGRQFSGLYYVTSTTHTIDANGYRTEFQVKRDGI
jgi:phage protein D